MLLAFELDTPRLRRCYFAQVNETWIALWGAWNGVRWAREHTVLVVGLLCCVQGKSGAL